MWVRYSILSKVIFCVHEYVMECDVFDIVQLNTLFVMLNAMCMEYVRIIGTYLFFQLLHVKSIHSQMSLRFWVRLG